MMRLQTGRVDGSEFDFFLRPMALFSEAARSRLTFFRSSNRCAAFWRVVKCGIRFSPIASANEGQSSRS